MQFSHLQWGYSWSSHHLYAGTWLLRSLCLFKTHSNDEDKIESKWSIVAVGGGNDILDEEKIRRRHSTDGILFAKFQIFIEMPLAIPLKLIKQRFSFCELQFRRSFACSFSLLKDSTIVEHRYDSFFLQHLHLSRDNKVQRRASRGITTSLWISQGLYKKTWALLLYGSDYEWLVP